MTVSTHDLSLEEKASLTSGLDPWHLQGLPAHGIAPYMLTDGPHGLRKAVSADSINLIDSVPATCFPPAAGLSSSWNPDLVREVGRAIGQECVQEKVAVVLGPAVNIKRNPLGGRSFEYWSEDPYLVGHEAIGIVEGVQSQGIGTSLKHFAANNQETDRMRVDVRVSQRALREIYLPTFEHIVKTAKPWTLMCSYNKINGVYSSANRWLLTDLLRGEWGYQGLVMSDWGAVHDRVASLAAGLNLEMPPSGTDGQVVTAVQAGTLSQQQLDSMAAGVLDLIEKARPAMERTDYCYDVAEHHELARLAARESVVLLKNQDRLLPLDQAHKIAVIGEFARTPRYQGGGSSHIHPTRLDSFLDVLGQQGLDFSFAPGFRLDDSEQAAGLTDQAVDCARQADEVLLFLGLPEAMESEGFDRQSIELPAKQVELLAKVTAVNPRCAVVLANGSVVSVAGWQEQAQALVEGWLLGQAGAQALFDVLFGLVSPSGHLAQSIPLDLQDDPTMMNWPGELSHVDYGEGVFVGYRYFDSFNRPVAYPFGHGLTYSQFELDDVRLDPTVQGPALVRVTARLTNTGECPAAQTVQLYVRPGRAAVKRPVHELKAFTKVFLQPGQSAPVNFDLDSRSFAYWSEALDDWKREGGDYDLELGFSSRDIRQVVTCSVADDGKARPLTAMSLLSEWQEDALGGPVLAAALAAVAAQGVQLPVDPLSLMFARTMPLSSLAMFAGPGANQLVEQVVAAYQTAWDAAKGPAGAAG